MFHWCHLETEALMMLLSAIPFIGLYFKSLHNRWHKKLKTVCWHKCLGHNKCKENHPVNNESKEEEYK